MPRPSAHGPASLPTATPTAAVRRSAVRSLVVARRCWDAMFSAGAFHFLSMLAIFFVTGFGFFFTETKSLFYFFQFIGIETLGFIFSSSLIVHVRIAHSFH